MRDLTYDVAIKIGGTFIAFIVTTLSIYEFVQLKFDKQDYFIYGIISVWIISKLISLGYALIVNRSEFSFGYFLLFGLFQAEWFVVIFQNNIVFIMIVFIYQTIINTLPTVISNIYLLSDTTRDIDHGYYISLIFIYYLFIGIAIIFSIGRNTQGDYYFDQFYLILPSIAINLCFWYLLVQCFIFNYIIGISILIGNLTVCLFDIIHLSKQKLQLLSEQQQSEYILFQILQYLFQINIRFFSNFSKNQSYFLKLQSWQNLFALTVQCLNILLLSVIKFIYYALIIQTDKAFYSFLCLSLFQIYLLIINIFYKLKKQNSYLLKLNCCDFNFQIEERAYELLEERFTYDYKVEIEYDSSWLIKENLKQFDNNLQTLKNFIKVASKNSNHSTFITVQDINKQITLQIHIYCQINLQKVVQQFIVISEEFSVNDQNQQMLKNICMLLNNNIKTEINIHSDKIEEIQNLLLQIVSFNIHNYNYQSYGYEYQIKFQKMIFEIISIHYSTLAFCKDISKFLHNNPQIVLYDLFEEIF